jgi:hypothetical protein
MVITVSFKLPSALADGQRLHISQGFSPNYSAKAGCLFRPEPLAKANGNLKRQEVSSLVHGASPKAI